MCGILQHNVITRCDDGMDKWWHMKAHRYHMEDNKRSRTPRLPKHRATVRSIPHWVVRRDTSPRAYRLARHFHYRAITLALLASRALRLRFAKSAHRTSLPSGWWEETGRTPVLHASGALYRHLRCTNPASPTNNASLMFTIMPAVGDCGAHAAHAKKRVATSAQAHHCAPHRRRISSSFCICFTRHGVAKYLRAVACESAA